MNSLKIAKPCSARPETPSATSLNASPFADDLAFCDLHIGSICDIDLNNTPLLRTPLRPGSPLVLSPDNIDLSAFPMFDAEIGPTANSSVSLHPLFSRAKLRDRENMISPTALPADDMYDILLSPIAKRKTSNVSRTSTCRPPKIVKKNEGLTSIPEASSQLEPCSPCLPRQSQRCPLRLHNRSTVSNAIDYQVDELSNSFHPCPYDSYDHNKSSRPTLVPGFIQSLPPFRLPTTPLAAPIVISPATPSRCTTLLRSPFLIQKKERGHSSEMDI
ncbi:hypothetical protein BDP27DRAFT_1413966 [Rhodocollybia butyracea]|uniref:Uncharacterized protein n=1 Tax=Rhodocollybia butyracea TaxID=206335 RepID=A0A9P5UF21_9AGAR|nr:hypothetical protein BDP27DRAFT_1413966 [Rhodocollybia butyracea]